MREWGHTQHSCDRDVEGAQVGLTKEAVVDRRDEAGHDEDDDARIVQPPYRLHQAAVSTARGRPSSSKAVTAAVQLQLAATAAASGMAGLPLIWEVLNPKLGAVVQARQLPTCHPWRLAHDPAPRTPGTLQL